MGVIIVNAGFGPPSVPCLDEGVGSPRQLLPNFSLKFLAEAPSLQWHANCLSVAEVFSSPLMLLSSERTNIEVQMRVRYRFCEAGVVVRAKPGAW